MKLSRIVMHILDCQKLATLNEDEKDHQVRKWQWFLFLRENFYLFWTLMEESKTNVSIIGLESFISCCVGPTNDITQMRQVGPSWH